MIKNYLKIAWRNLLKNKASSVINIGGLAVGMAVAMLIGLWIYSELSFDKNIPNHDHIAQVMQNQWINNETDTWNSQAYPLGPMLRAEYGADFKHVIMSSWTGGHIFSIGDKNLKVSGNFMEPGITDMLSLKMIKGSRNGLNDPNSILLSQSAVKAVFGDADPMNKIIKIDHDDVLTVKVTGVYEDLPENSSFGDLTFISPWQLLVKDQHYDTRFGNPWGASWFQTLVQIADNADMNKVSYKIKDIKMKDLQRTHNSDARFKPVIFLHPMNNWHLYGDFKNGANTGGDIQYVWLFGVIGVFVLLLACINFMNLSTARSEKRAKEVGIRKSVGSVRSQLIAQFYCESLVIAFFSFLFAILFVQLSLPFFNEVAGKKTLMPWGSSLFWLAGIGFTLFTGLIAGSYPALYLSSFNPVKVLKGTFRAGRLASVPRKVLVVVQFTVSIVLIIGTIVVFNQVQYAKNRPIGFNVSGLMIVPLQTDYIAKKYDAIKNDLLTSGVAASVSQSQTRITDGNSSNGGFTWQGKDPALQENFKSLGISAEFGKTAKWQIKEGRDFDPSLKSDSSGFVINEACVKYLGFKNPIGQTITWIGNGNYKIIGVVKDIVSESAYQPVQQTFYWLRKDLNNVDIRLSPNTSAHEAIDKIGAIFKKYDPSTPFEYSFADDDYAKKFDTEERVGKLASSFAGLAIFISCLGLFGMASFMAEQRVKEIGVRKVLGASVFNLWRLLSKDFVGLVVISLFIASPLAYYFMHKWLEGYTYRTSMGWWIFGITAAGALLITVLTVSYQSLKAAMANPVRSLRSE
ncbi:ABC transporter permease [Mucilaginibacter sp. BT774]|uniref:ABC transporter permease n=1 Tax=Mucilaginibacter sp. BT774 TaxID=3062276 RepID=UPI0026754FEF|nr:ABC transporter permease [Mucilaginibacter sp. BT774]MDO3628070.1 ABC transporter permease [Mucilaginibacter sp. BT774]